MMTIIQNFHFIRPMWLLALIIPVILYFYFFKGTKSKSSWEGEVDKNLLKFMLKKGSSTNRKIISYISIILIVLTIIAVAGPTWNKKQAPTAQPENPVMILLNLSTDMIATDISPNRLIRAKYKISDFLHHLEHAQVGLIVYTDEPFLISPITDDKNIISNLISGIDYDIVPTNGDRLDRALEFAAKKLKDAGYENGNIVIFSSDVGQRFDLAIAASRKIGEHFTISVINVSPKSNEKLETIATKGNGRYISITPNDKDIKLIAESINRQYSHILKVTENMSMVWEEYGYWLSIIIAFLSLYFFKKGIFVIVFSSVVLSGTANAGFFFNNNQEGIRYFSNEDYEKAAEKFDNPDWKAASYYRKGEFEKAFKLYSKSSDTASIYNQGNALAKSGKIEDAIKKYEEVLEQNPNHEDAKFNLEYLKQQQEQQQKNDSQDNKDNNEQEQKNNSSSSDKEQDSQENNQDQDDSQDKNDNSEIKNQDLSTQDKDEENDEQNSQEDQSPKMQEQNDVNEGEDEIKASAQNNDEQNKDWDEEIQAREQQYREIPENPGGLLRAVIKKEYRKNRYKD